MGCVPLPHAMRQGNKTVSWYRGPLVPGNNTSKEFSLPIRTADELVYYDETCGVFDVSYSAAWELGRLLALQSKSFSLSLYHWKRTHARKLKDDAEAQLTHLPFDGPSVDLDLPETVISWFEHLMLLEEVPFHYLVPDERMLPAESIRFFQVDPLWLECLLDGAFSIGRVLSSDHKQDNSYQKDHINPLLPNRISGFLLRSDIVAGWPGLQVEGYDEANKKTDFTLDKVFLFENKQVQFETLLKSTKLKEELQIESDDKKKKLSIQKWNVKNQKWSISNNQHQQFKLIKRENNEIDVCSSADMKYLFSIDAGFETDLNNDKISTELQQVFQAQKQAILADSHISVLSWFVTDNEHHTHYVIEKEANSLKVYRSYKLPLLRMARLSANILICLFEGVVQMVDLHLKPETLHFGVDKQTDKEPYHFYKKLKKAGKTIKSFTWKEEEMKVIKISALADDIQKELEVKNFSVADFAFEMIEGVEKVRFSL